MYRLGSGWERLDYSDEYDRKLDLNSFLGSNYERCDSGP